MANKISGIFLIVLMIFSLPVKASNNNVDIYKDELERCWRMWNTTNVDSDSEILDIIDASEKCMQKVGYSIIDHFYIKHRDVMINSFNAFIQTLKDFEQNICTKNDSDSSNITSIKDVTAASSSLYLLKQVIEDMINAIQGDLDD